MAAKERDMQKLAENSESKHVNVCVCVSERVSLYFKSTVLLYVINLQKLH
jgi:hypothetical protein